MSTAPVPKQADHTSASAPQQHASVNVGESERFYSLLGGAALGLIGLSTRGPRGLLILAMGGGLLYRGATGHCHLYETLGIHTNHPKSDHASIASGQGVHVVHSVTIKQPAQTLYTFWRDFQNLPKFMKHVDGVEILNEKQSRWRIETPIGDFKWQAVIINDSPPETIAWRSEEGSEIACAGSVSFKELPNDFGTQVDVNLRYDAPGGRAGAFLASLFGKSPEQFIREDLRRFKQLMETGEIPTTAGQPKGECC